MKKIISILIVCMFVASAAALCVSADGSILFSDDFNSGVINEANWYPGAFTVENGGPLKSPYADDWAGNHVLQTMYGTDNGSDRIYGANIAVKVDAWAFEDGGEDFDEHRIGIWWADCFTEDVGGDGRIVYTAMLFYEGRTVQLFANGEGTASEYFDGQTLVGEWKLPDSVEFEMDVSEPTVANIGMRINGAQIDVFFNNQKVISYTAPRMGQFKCPVLLLNSGCHAGFDNFVISTADYNLFNESAEQAQNQQNAPAATEKVIETKKVVVGTDVEGNEITEIVTEEVVRPAAQTSNGTTGGTSSATGDMAIIVIAVMIISIGGAIVAVKARKE
jgi:hypothetical protein